MENYWYSYAAGKPNNFLKIILESFWHEWFISAEWKPLSLRWQTWGSLVVMPLSWDKGPWAHIHPWSGHEKWLKAKLSYPEVHSHHSPQWQEGLQRRQLFRHFPPSAAKFPIKSVHQINPVLSWTKLHFSAKKISSSRGEWNPIVVLSSHRLGRDIIQKFPWSIQTQTSSGTAQAIQNTFKNNYERLPARFIYAPSTPVL